ncbi:MAG: DNA adenine methylase [Ktedonobacteraceae bacterium]|nr:DNA adenine methylase [Ktedonobacteraceae bacterium]
MYWGAEVIRTGRLASLLKWAGGKEQELRYILPMIPPFQRYFEPFIGGGAVFFSIQSEKKLINDKSSELISLYRMVAEKNSEFFQTLNDLLYQWQRVSQFVDIYAAELISMYKTYSMDVYDASKMREILYAFVLSHIEDFNDMFARHIEKNSENFLREIKRNLVSKTTRMKQLENKKGKLPDSDIVANMESALKSAFYMHLRHLYNNIDTYEIAPGAATAIFFLVRENAYASMFRYNSRGEFNVPYGGISYNRKDLARKIAYMQSPEVQQHFINTVIENMDFEEFFQEHTPAANDFIFLDPPYDSEFSTYTQNIFDKSDQERLAYYLLNRCTAKFMLVIKNTPRILHLYAGKGLNIQTFDKKYLVSFQDRNNRESEHLIITNYDQISNLSLWNKLEATVSS